MIQVRVLGAAGGVTGSAYLVETSQTKVLVDLGMFQGRDARTTNGNGERIDVNASLGVIDPRSLAAVVLTHAHLDHTGRLPMLTRAGYNGPIFATPASGDLTEAVLRDSAGIQEQDTQRENRKRERAGLDPIEPIYTKQDAEAVYKLIKDVPYAKEAPVAPGVKIRYYEAGHILGSASIAMTVSDAGVTKKIVFSGDIGPRNAPILRDPEPPSEADLVFLESTYGDKEHPGTSASVERLIRIVRDTIFNKQRVIIPAFAIGRTQLLLYHLICAHEAGELADIPVYLDSPAAKRATEVYMKHTNLYDAEATKLARCQRLVDGLKSLRLIETANESRALNESWDPCVIIAGSGMCEGGRIVHHLRHNLWRRGTAVVLVGYMAEGTLGRKLADGADQVFIFNDPIAVRADIHRLDGFSAHAGRSELLAWPEKMMKGRPRLVLTHGEDGPRAALAAGLKDRYGVAAELPMRGDVIHLAN
jgi:metallo-beta-lactamase family protein